MDLRRIRILGQPVDVVALPAAVAHLAGRIEEGDKQFVVAQNPEKIMKCLADDDLAGIIEDKATLVIADGVGVAIAARVLGLGRIPRVPGIELFHALLALAGSRGKRVFLYGAAPEICERAVDVVERTYPGVELVGAHHGYDDSESRVLERIRQARPDFLFVALGTPKQEKWIARHFERLPVACAMGIGGSLDVLAGHMPGAPVLMRRIGTEWLFRLAVQPSRLRRSITLPRFVWRVVACRWRGDGVR